MRGWGNEVVTKLMQLRHIVVSMLREIFDESAYSRYLQRNAMAASSVAYGKFIREQSELKARRPKCC